MFIFVSRKLTVKKILLISSIGCLVVAGSVLAKTITIAGSTSIKPIMESITQDYQKNHPGIEFVIEGGGSKEGIHLITQNKIMIAMISRDLEVQEKQAYPDLVATTIGRDAVALVVHQKTPINQITKKQIQEMYIGHITNWKDLGGPPGRITLVAMGPNHGTHELFCKFFDLESHQEADKMLTHKLKGSASFSTIKTKSVESSPGAMVAVMTHPESIAYVSIGAAHRLIARGAPVKLTQVEGVDATKENVVLGRYPICRNLNLITRGQPDGSVKAFINYVTHHPLARKRIAELDFIPLDREG